MEWAFEAVLGKVILFFPYVPGRVKLQNVLTKIFTDVAQAIMSKILPTMFMHFEWGFVDPSADRKLVSK